MCVFFLAGRQVKMAFVNSVAKPPRDVRRRQEKFGTTSTSTASSTAAAAPIKYVDTSVHITITHCILVHTLHVGTSMFIFSYLHLHVQRHDWLNGNFIC